MSDRNDKDVSAQEMLQDLSEIERDLTLRGLLWQSQEEWDTLAEQWTDSIFDSLNIDSLQKNVNRFTQTVYMLEKSKFHFGLHLGFYQSLLQILKLHYKSEQIIHFMM